MYGTNATRCSAAWWAREGVAMIVNKVCVVIRQGLAVNMSISAATSLRSAGSPLGPSTYCTSTPQDLRAPRAALATRLRVSNEPS